MKSLTLHGIALTLLVVAGGCHSTLSGIQRNGWPPPAKSRVAFAADYADKQLATNADGQQYCPQPPSLYALLTGEGGVPSDPNGRFVTRVEVGEGDRFRLTLFDGASSLRSASLDMKFKDGVLDGGCRVSGSYLLPGAYLNESCTALGLSETGDLVVWQREGETCLLLGIPVCGDIGGSPNVYVFRRMQW